MIRICLSFFLLLSLSVVVRASDEVPGAPQKQPIALVNGLIHTVTGPPIEEGSIVFEDGCITEIGRRLKPPKAARVIDLKGADVYPGLIESMSQMGLYEIGAVRATLDYRETGSLNPNVEARVSVNPDSEIIPVTRANGVLLAVTAPAGGRISGRASVLQLDGWTYEDLTLKADVGMVVNWPRLSPRFSRFGRSSGDSAEEVGELRELFDDARAYRRAREAGSAEQLYDIRLEALLPVIDGAVPLIVMADGAMEIQSAVAFCDEQEVGLIICGGREAEQCAALLKSRDIPVIISAVYRSPRRRHADYDESYTLPERLRTAGVRFCISSTDRSETWNTRNLPYEAATACAYGLPYEDALKSVTLYPAQILGIDDRVGSLEVGKDATLMVTTGDPLETETQVTHAWVQGRRVQLTSRHTRLYEKYRTKYRQQR